MVVFYKYLDYQEYQCMSVYMVGYWSAEFVHPLDWSVKLKSLGTPGGLGELDRLGWLRTVVFTLVALFRIIL